MIIPSLPCVTPELTKEDIEKIVLQQLEKVKLEPNIEVKGPSPNFENFQKKIEISLK